MEDSLSHGERQLEQLGQLTVFEEAQLRQVERQARPVRSYSIGCDPFEALRPRPLPSSRQLPEKGPHSSGAGGAADQGRNPGARGA